MDGGLNLLELSIMRVRVRGVGLRLLVQNPKTLSPNPNRGGLGDVSRLLGQLQLI